MDSISKECTPLKHKFDACFTRWYSEKFLKGAKTNDCKGLFEEYQACLMRALEAQGLVPMISEARPSIGSAFAASADADKSSKK